jgi:homoserine kinase type II
MKGKGQEGKMDRVYVLQHTYDLDGCEETKFIGVYRSQGAADAAVRKLRHQPGFSERPAGFNVDAYELDKDHWEEGFVTD